MCDCHLMFHAEYNGVCYSKKRFLQKFSFFVLLFSCSPCSHPGPLFSSQPTARQALCSIFPAYKNSPTNIGDIWFLGFENKKINIYHFHYVVVLPCCVCWESCLSVYSSLMLVVALEQQTKIWGIGIHLVIDILSGNPKLPDSRVKYYFPL